MPPTTPSFSLKPIVHADISVLAEMSGLAFENDRHTMLKAAHPAKPYDHAAGMPGAFEYWLGLPPGKVEMTKAVDDESGEILGFICWGLRLDHFDISTEQQSQGVKEVQSATKDTTPDPVASEDFVETPSPNLDALAQLEELTSSHLADYQKRVMPSGTRCMYVIGITVHPNHQGRGVGPALIKQGTDRADAEGVFCWVHSSEAGLSMFRKCGFRVDDTLEVDLDRWAGSLAINPPAGEERWGIYTFTYMVRQPMTP